MFLLLVFIRKIQEHNHLFSLSSLPFLLDYNLRGKKYSVNLTQGPSAHGQLERVDRFSFGNLKRWGVLGINKKKALDYLQTSAPIAVSSSSQELSSDGKDNDNNDTSKEKKGETLQTAAGKDQYRRGIALYGSILLEVLGNKDSDNSVTSPNKLTEEVQGSHYLNLAFVLFWVGGYGVPFHLGPHPWSTRFAEQNS